MEFLEKLKERIDNKAKAIELSSFSYFIECANLKIHYVTIENFNLITYKAVLKQLFINHNFFINVFEDQFKIHPEKIMDRLEYKYGKSQRIHGRNTTIRKIDKPTALSFLESNHGNIALKTKYNYALSNKKGKLVAIACFGQVINMRSGAKSSELIRFCNLSGSRVVGGLTKLIHHFKKKHNLDELMTYCDLDWSDGSNFKKLNFNEIGPYNPTKFVINIKTWERTPAVKFHKEHNKTQLNLKDYKTVENLGSIKFIKYFND